MKIVTSNRERAALLGACVREQRRRAPLGPARLVALAAGAICRFSSAVALVDQRGAINVLVLALDGTIASTLADDAGAPAVWRHESAVSFKRALRSMATLRA